MDRTATRYHSQFMNPPDGGNGIVGAGRKYLTEHGINDRGIVRAYRLGVVIDPLPGDEPFRGMLCFPYMSPLGGVKVIRYRALSDSGPKIAQYTNQEARLYNTSAVLTADRSIGIAEGEADAIAATECLGMPTVGIPGVETWTAHERVWRLAFRDFRIIWMLADGDVPDKTSGRRPGRELAKAVSVSVSSADTEVRVIECPESEDVSSMVAAGRQGWFTEKIASDGDDNQDD